MGRQSVASATTNWSDRLPEGVSVLSREPDGCGYYYGHVPGDPRRIDVARHQGPAPLDEKGVELRWVVYVDGERFGRAATLAEAEMMARKHLRENPKRWADGD